MRVEKYFALPHNYEAEHIPYTTGGEETEPIFFPRATRRGGHEGILVRITPQEGSPWIGNFALGRGGQTGIFSTPDPGKLCVSAAGEMYLIKVDKLLAEDGEIPCVTQIFQLPKLNMLMLIASCEIVALGRNGPIWRRNDITGSYIYDVESESMSGTREDCGRDIPFRVNTRTGRSLKASD